MKMNDAARRAIRTLLQFVVAGGLTAIINQFIVNLSANEKVLIQGGGMLVVTFAQNYLEDYTSFPAILKAPPSAGQNPVPADEPQV